MAAGIGFPLSGFCKIQVIVQLVKNNKTNDMITLILFLAGLICFFIFFKSIDFFDKI